MAIGTTAAMVGASAIGGIAQASAASKAAKSQASAANSQLGLQKAIYEDTTERFAPYVDSGVDFQNALRFELLGGERPVMGGDPARIEEFTSTTPGAINANAGTFVDRGRDSVLVPQRGPDVTNTAFRVGDQTFTNRAEAEAYAAANPTGGTTYGGFEATPYQQYILDESQKAVDGSAASRGNLFSGATIKAQQDRAQTMAGGFYDNFLNRLTQGAASGQNAAGLQASAGQNYATGASNAYANIGNAQAAGAIGMGNAITGGINNALNIWGWQQAGAGGLTPGGYAPSSSLRPMARPVG